MTVTFDCSPALSIKNRKVICSTLFDFNFLKSTYIRRGDKNLENIIIHGNIEEGGFEDIFKIME